MSGGQMASLGAVAHLLGAGLNYMGQSQGAKAMQREAERQAQIQADIARQKHLAVIESLGRYDPNAQGVLAGMQARRGMQAAAPAIAAGGAALGLQGGQTVPVGAGIMTGQRVAGQRAAAEIQGQRTAQNLQRLAATERGINESGQLAGQLADASVTNAGNKGSALRLAGEITQGVGMPLMVMGMNQKAPVKGAKVAPVEGVEVDPVASSEKAARLALARAEAAGYRASQFSTTPPIW
jgi:hypothetical protein